MSQATVEESQTSAGKGSAEAEPLQSTGLQEDAGAGEDDEPNAALDAPDSASATPETSSAITKKVRQPRSTAKQTADNQSFYLQTVSQWVRYLSNWSTHPS